MRFLSRTLFVLFLLLGVLLALSNSQPVELSLWPLPHVLRLPLWLLVAGLLLGGCLAGLAVGWWSGRRYRKRARDFANKAWQLEHEVIRLRQSLAAKGAPPEQSPAANNPRLQRSIERQSALVAPDLAVSKREPPA